MKLNGCLLLAVAAVAAAGQGVATPLPKTYCNPLDLDYTYQITQSDEDISYRSGADPAVVRFRGAYYMFVTRSMGYWTSPDMTRWTFVKPERWYFEGSNAPAAHNWKDQTLYVTVTLRA